MDFNKPIVEMGDKLIQCSVEIYMAISLDLLPTPEKSHYIFNLRDLSKCVQGILQADSGIIIEQKQMLRLFYHECLRVYHDRLINNEDRTYFYRLLSEACMRYFKDDVFTLPDTEVVENLPTMFFGDFIEFSAPKEKRFYEEMTDVSRIKHVLLEYLEDYCTTYGKNLSLIFFMDAVEHICRLCRILRSERGNGLLVGVGGCGKQSLTKVASHINGYM